MKLLFSWQVRTAALLIAVSALLYYLFSLVYDINAHHIIEVILGHVAFLPVHVLIITLIIHGIFDVHKKKTLLEKLNTVVGSFHCEVGGKLLKMLREFDKNPNKIGEKLNISRDWNRRRFKETRKKITDADIDIDAQTGDLPGLRSFLSEKRVFLLRLMENPNLVERDGFTELLWAVVHLADELDHREDLSNLPKSDYDHLSSDIKRTYTALIKAWLPYMMYLNEKYPYQYSLALRSNPFDPEASVIVDE